MYKVLPSVLVQADNGSRIIKLDSHICDEHNHPLYLVPEKVNGDAKLILQGGLGGFKKSLNLEFYTL